MEQFEFFWNGPFSQWHPSNFSIGGVNYNCAEQWMMAEKARLFKDEKALRDIMITHRPNEQKAIGRTVRGFDIPTWNNEAKLIVYRGSLAKFLQNQHLHRELVATKGKTLVEASPFDKIWGIGLEEDDPKAKSRDTWQGQNWLGDVLTKLRIDFIGE